MESSTSTRDDSSVGLCGPVPVSALTIIHEESKGKTCYKRKQYAPTVICKTSADVQMIRSCSTDVVQTTFAAGNSEPMQTGVQGCTVNVSEQTRNLGGGERSHRACGCSPHCDSFQLDGLTLCPKGLGCFTKSSRRLWRHSPLRFADLHRLLRLPDTYVVIADLLQQGLQCPCLLHSERCERRRESALFSVHH
jgi:hypothetical protein